MFTLDYEGNSYHGVRESAMEYGTAIRLAKAKPGVMLQLTTQKHQHTDRANSTCNVE